MDSARRSDHAETVLGYDVDVRPVVECISDVVAWVRGGRECRWLGCFNPHSYVVALEDPGFASALKHADWLVPDGVGIVLASRVLRGGIRSRLTGSDVFEGVHRRLNAEGGARVFFLGSTEPVLAEIRKRMAEDYPNLEVVGTYSPPFSDAYSDSELTRMLDVISAADPDVLWVGMTAPKQEKWLQANRHRLNAPFAAAVGAVFDFYSGRIKRSSAIYQRLGLEWLPRLLQEPRRLARRMFRSAPIFVGHVIRARLTGWRR